MNGTVWFDSPSLKVDRNGDWVHAVFEIDIKNIADGTATADVMRMLAQYLRWSADNPLDLSWLAEAVDAAGADK